MLNAKDHSLNGSSDNVSLNFEDKLQESDETISTVKQETTPREMKVLQGK